MRQSGTNRPAAAGFTLVELLVVMAVIAILLTLLVPVISSSREQANIVQTNAIIDGVSMALDSYRQVHNTYPPDQGPGDADKSSECLVYYLSGGSIAYNPNTQPDYEWADPLFQDTTGDGSGRMAHTIYYEFKRGQLEDGDNDNVPELVDPWRIRFIYNTGSSTNSTYNQYNAPKHRLRKYDLFSAGPDKEFGTSDDINNWDDSKGYLYGSYNLNSGDH
jgi:prepilin-type N-terminal cleavage/methylation domain-containing protein